jgi:hypothetical protein
VTPQGFPEITFCECLPAGIAACTDAEPPACAGVCAPGALCGDDGDGGCVCVALELQGPCAEAQAPTCGGTCDAQTICEPDGSGGCTCAPHEGQDEACLVEDAPACGGACAGGKMCGVNFDVTCKCFSPCELGAAPACAGVCVDESRSCVAATSTLGDGLIENCICR